MKRYILLLIIATIAIAVNGQGFINRTPDFPQIETPNTASFNKFIDNPISLYNGTPDVNIPIYTVKDGAVEIPISLRYNTSGIKVNEEASWVGLGWNLNVGGVITQSVVGDYDFYDTEYNNILNKLGGIESNLYVPYSSPYYTQTMHNSFRSYVGAGNLYRSGKLNPDVFYYSYPGGAGKFIIDYRNDKIYILSRSTNELIQITGRESTGGKINTFQITTTEGIQHKFELKATLKDINQLMKIASLSYVLVETIYPNQQSVKYEYDTWPILKHYKSDYCQAAKRVTAEACKIGIPYVGESRNCSEGVEFYLKKIQTPNYDIVFGKTTRLDIMNGERLSSIKINSRISDDSKEFGFDYDYFNGTNTNSRWIPSNSYSSNPSLQWKEDYGLKRLKLKSVYQKSGSSMINKYEFKYDETPLPDKNSYAVDYWGYYNNKGGQTYLPDLERMAWGSICNGGPEVAQLESFSTEYKSKSGNRGYNFEYAKAGILTEINYPTGGSKIFTYEPNKYMSLPMPGADESLINPNLPVPVRAEDQNTSSLPQRVSFQIAKANTKAELKMNLSRGFNTWWSMRGSVIRIYKNNSVFWEYDLTSDCSTYERENTSSGNMYKDFTVTLTQTGLYELYVDIPNALGDQYGSNKNHGSLSCNLNFTSMIEPLKTGLVNGCGIRVKSITSYDNKNYSQPVLTTEYEYSNPILHEILKYVQSYRTTVNYFQFGDGYPINGIPQKELTAMEMLQCSGSNTASDPYNSTGSIGYTEVKEYTKSITQVDNGYTLHKFSNKEPQFAEGSVRIDDPLNGRLQETEVYDKDRKLLKKERNVYKATSVNRYFGINFQDNLNLFPQVYSSSSASCKLIDYTSDNGYFAGFTGYTRMTLLIHLLNIHDITLTSKETFSDGVTISETFSYDSQTLQITEKIKTTDGRLFKHAYKYPNNFNCGIYPSMIQKNMFSNIVEEQVYQSNYYIGGNVIEYSWSKDGKNILPVKLYYSELTDAVSSPSTYSCSGVNTAIFPYTTVWYNEYDPFGNINYIVHNDNTNIVYLWSYNGQYLVAEIKDATYEQASKAVSEVFGMTIDALSKAVNPDASKLQLLYKNTNLTNALVTTYTYRPLTGILTMTGPSGLITYFDYDIFGRLKESYIIENGQKKILQANDYHYQK